MDFIKGMQKSLDYIEEHLDGNIDVGDLAKLVYVSPTHYQRMFHMLSGFTLGEYIRKRRLTMAAMELQKPEAKVIDTALTYGYQTPEAFTKAFRKIHGLNPSVLKHQSSQHKIKAYPKITFQIQIKGVKEMDYQIQKKKGFKIVGEKRWFSTKDGENFREIPKFWEEVKSNGVFQILEKNVGELGFLGVVMNFDEQKEGLEYMIAVEKSENQNLKGMTVEEIPEGNWAVFESIGPMPDAIQETFQRIYSEWFPSTGYEHAGGPELEVYLPGDLSAEDYRCQVWIPIK